MRGDSNIHCSMSGHSGSNLTSSGVLNSAIFRLTQIAPITIFELDIYILVISLAPFAGHSIHLLKIEPHFDVCVVSAYF